MTYPAYTPYSAHSLPQRQDTLGQHDPPFSPPAGSHLGGPPGPAAGGGGDVDAGYGGYGYPQQQHPTFADLYDDSRTLAPHDSASNVHAPYTSASPNAHTYPYPSSHSPPTSAYDAPLTSYAAPPAGTYTPHDPWDATTPSAYPAYDDYSSHKPRANLDYAEAGAPLPPPHGGEPFNENRAFGNAWGQQGWRGMVPFTADKGKYPVEQQIENRRRGIFRQRFPILTWAIAVGCCIALIIEIVQNKNNTGSPFAPGSLNPMGGPTPANLIRTGARYRPCMTTVPVEGIPSPLTASIWPDIHDSRGTASNSTLATVCGFGMQEGEKPAQRWRFILPVFLHAGILHLVLNMLGLLVVSAQAERMMGTFGFAVLYTCAGVFGNILGGNFSAMNTPSTGASGAIMGTIAVNLVDLVAHWRLERNPGRMLIIHLVELVFIFAMGLIPYLDNFAHIGGWVQGFLLSVVLLPVITQSKRHTTILWICRIAALVVSIVLFIVLAKNFEKDDPSSGCSWCVYLSCIPSNANNHCSTTIQTTTSSSSSGNSGSLRF